jgi:hypothetical protein
MIPGCPFSLAFGQGKEIGKYERHRFKNETSVSKRAGRFQLQHKKRRKKGPKKNYLRLKPSCCPLTVAHFAAPFHKLKGYDGGFGKISEKKQYYYIINFA